MNIRNPANSEKIATAIRASRFSQRDLARALGVSDVTVSNYCNGWRKPSPTNLTRLAAVLDVDVRDLINDY